MDHILVAYDSENFLFGFGSRRGGELSDLYIFNWRDKIVERLYCDFDVTLQLPGDYCMSAIELETKVIIFGGTKGI